MKKITVFTPTYNRAYIIGKAYKSLKRQTEKNFIWLVVDDGSTDDTNELIKKWKKENAIDIQYIKQENQGKHIAHNTAVENCKTEYMLILDSDDFLNDKAIEILNKKVEEIKDNEKIAGIIGNRFSATDKKVIGTYMPKNINIASGLELYQKYGHKGDTLRLYKTKVLKNYLFPKIKGEKFIYENVVFDIIDSKYKMLIINEELYYGDYLKDGYTSNESVIKKKNFKGYALSLESSAIYSIYAKERIKYNILYIIWCRRYNIEMNKKIKNIFIYIIAVIFEKIKYPRFFFK